MPTIGYDDYRERCARLKAKAAKLIAKGIDPRSQKFLRLLHRR